MDFTLAKYRELLEALKGREVFLRHDVDKKPGNSLETAKIEAAMGLKATYYFRAVPESWDDEIILKISALGHEIGYHYESLTTCNGDVDAAYSDFLKNLEKLSALVGKPVTTICMHGSPRSRWDSKDIWKKYDYHSLGITLEPYLDTDFSQCFYLTDTGRRWDGYKVSVRDRIPGWQEKWMEAGLVFHTTDDIVRAASDGKLPERMMITTHPQRWTDNKVQWTKEFVLQNLKNAVKRLKIKKKSVYL